MSYNHRRASKPKIGFLRGMVQRISFEHNRSKANTLRAQGHTVEQIAAALDLPEETIRILLMDWEYE